MIRQLKEIWKDWTEKCHHMETKVHMHFTVLGDDRNRQERVVVRECLDCGRHIKRVW